MQFNRRLVFFLVIFSFASQVQAQLTTVRIKVTNQKQETVSFATVIILSVPDTIHQQQRVSDSTGVSSFQLLQGKPYRVRITSVNYQPLEKSITIKGDDPLYS